MRIYDGSPRQDWEEVLRSIGAFADSERLKEILFLELEGGFLLQGLGLPAGSADSDSFGALVKRTYELTDDQVGEMMDAIGREARLGRGGPPARRPQRTTTSSALRIIGAYIDSQKAHDVFLLRAGRLVRRCGSSDVARLARSRPPAVRIHPRRDVGYDRVRT